MRFLMFIIRIIHTLTHSLSFFLSHHPSLISSSTPFILTFSLLHLHSLSHSFISTLSSSLLHLHSPTLSSPLSPLPSRLPSRLHPLPLSTPPLSSPHSPQCAGVVWGSASVRTAPPHTLSADDEGRDVQEDHRKGEAGRPPEKDKRYAKV